MTIDPRLIVGVGAVAAALLVALWAHRRERRRARRSDLRLDGLTGRILFFTDATCTRCDIVRAHLQGLGANFTELAYGDDPATHRRVGVTGVPLLVIRDADGAEVHRFAGVVSKTRLATALPRD